MKFIYCCLFTILLVNATSAQDYIDKWHSTYSAQGSLDIAGTALSSTGDLYILATKFTGGDYDAILLKYDPNGNLDWEKSYSSNYGSSEDYGVDLLIDGSDNIYILININPDAADNSNVANGFTVRKYNSSGTLLSNYENVNDSSIKIGYSAYHIEMSSDPSNTDIFLTTTRPVVVMGLEARLWRLSSSLTWEASTKYDTSDDDIPVQLTFSSATFGYEPMMAVQRADRLQVLIWTPNFAINANYDKIRGYVIGSSVDVIDVHVALNTAVILTRNVSNLYTFSRFSTAGLLPRFTEDISSNIIPNNINACTSGGCTAFTYLSGTATEGRFYVRKYDATASTNEISYSRFLATFDDMEASLVRGRTQVGSGVVDGERFPVMAYRDNDGGLLDVSRYSSATTTGISHYESSGTTRLLIGKNGSNSIRVFAMCSGAPDIDLGADVESYATSVTLSAPFNTNYTYLWSTGETTRQIDVSNDGTYSVQVFPSNGCPGADEISVTLLDKVDQTITFNSINDKVDGDDSFQPGATSSSGLTVTYVSSDESVISIVGEWAHIEGPGTATITAKQSGNLQYNPAPDVHKTVTVIPNVYVWENETWNIGETSYPSYQPTIMDEVRLAEDYNLTTYGAFATRHFTIDPSATLTITAPHTLIVNGDFTNNGSVIVESGASLITYRGFTRSGNDINIIRNTRYSDGKYSFVGSPVESNSQTTVSDLGSNVYSYDESASSDMMSLSRWIVPIGTHQLSPARGYTQANQQMIEFVGKPNTGTITYTGSYENDGWHLVSNPYAAAIFIDDFLDANTNTTDAIYIWDDNGSDTGRGSNNDYIVANKTAATDISGSDNASRWNEHIGSAQGFFVKLDGSPGNITFTEAMRVSGNNSDNNFFRTLENKTPILRLNLTHADGLIRQAIIGWNESVSNTEISEGYDAPVFNTDADYAIYSEKAGQYLTIQTITSEREDVAVGFNIAEAGHYSIEFKLEHLSEIFYLHDQVTDEFINVNNGPYNFYSEAAKFNDRFVLTKRSNVLALEDQLLNIYAFDKVLHIETTGSQPAQYQVFNLSGVSVMNINASGSTTLNLSHLTDGIYIVSDGIKSKKIILK